MRKYVSFRPWIGLSLLALWLFGLAETSNADTKPIRLRNQMLATPDPEPASKARLQGGDPEVTGLYLVQLQDRLKPEWKEVLRARNVLLLRYVPEDAFVARLSGTSLAGLRSLSFVRWVGEYFPAYKVEKSLQTGAQGPGKDLAVSVLLSPAATQAETLRTVRMLRETRMGRPMHSGRILHGNVPSSQLSSLASLSSVLWVEAAPRMKLMDEVASWIVGGEPDTTNAHGTIVQDLGYDGRGVTVAVADSGLHTGEKETMHPDLAGRVDALFYYGSLQDASDEHSHGTHVAGIIAGNGATGETDESGGELIEFLDPDELPSGRKPALYGLGVAPGAHLVAQRIFDGAGNYEAPPTYEVLTHDAVRAGAVIGSNSWGDDTQGRYDLSAAEFDALVRDADADMPGSQPYILEFSAGNAGPGSQTIGSPAVGKNVIATGASQNDRPEFFLYAEGAESMADFSSRGPCEDGRIKPDVVAPGTWIASLKSAYASDENAWSPISENYLYQGGTSQAGPHVSGAAAVFVQYYRQTHNGATPSPALTKAALIHSAVDMEAWAGTGPVPNADEGWGRVDLTELVATTANLQFLDQQARLSSGQSVEKQVLVGTTAEALKVTLVYTDVPGLPAAIPALVNDLDLEVVAPDGRIYRGNQFLNGESVPDAPSADRINNVEAVRVSSPQVGQYLVRVRAHNVVEDIDGRDLPRPEQDFALVVSGDIPSPGVGTLYFNRAAFTVPDQIQIKLFDADLSAQNSVAVQLNTSSDPTGKPVVLLRAGPGGVFTNSIATTLSSEPGSGEITLVHEDLIQATYLDASPAATRTALARVDLIPPAIGMIEATNRLGNVAITWNTDEAASGTVVFGTNLPLANAITNTVLLTGQRVVISGLQTGVEYKYYVVATDEAGNRATNDNNGILFSFLPTPASTVLLVDAYVRENDLDPTEIPLTTYTDALDAAGVSYDIWDLTQPDSPSPNTNDLSPFAIVIWRTSDSFFSTSAITPAQQATLSSYVQDGGALFYCSMEALSRIGPTSFRTNILHVQSFAEDAQVPSVLGIDNEPLTSGMDMALDYTLYDNDVLQLLGIDPDVSDTFTPTTNAIPILLEPITGRIAGIKSPRPGSDSKGRVVFFSFPFDTLPERGDAPNNRAAVMRNVLSFLAPGLNGLGSVSFDNTAYTIPSLVTVEVSDSDLAGSKTCQITVSTSSSTGSLSLTLDETVRKGTFRGFFTLVATNEPMSAGRLPAKHGDTLRAEYADNLARGSAQALAQVDVQIPTISSVQVDPEYEQATVIWLTSKPTDALVQFGESLFLGRTAYESELSPEHEVILTGLAPGRSYFYQVVSRDRAGNTKIDDNNGKMYTFRTLQPAAPPITFDFEDGGASWAVWPGVMGEEGSVWQLGIPANGMETEAHSPTNAWASNLTGDAIDVADSRLVSPAIDLTGGNQATLRFWQSYDFSERSDLDIYEVGELYVSTNNAATWTLLDAYDEGSGGWEEIEISLTPYLGRVIRLSWYYGFFTLEPHPRPGWLIDDVTVTVTNVIRGTVVVTNNLAQASFSLSGPSTLSGRGLLTVFNDVIPGEYVTTFDPVPFFITPPPQTNVLTGTNVLALRSVYSIADTNHNGIPDSWEETYLGGVESSHPPETDSDGDHMSDYQEFMAGTNPTNNLSTLVLQPPVLGSGDTVQVAWETAPGRAYRILSSSDLRTWSAATPWIYPTTTSYSLALPIPNTARPYMLRLEASP